MIPSITPPTDNLYKFISLFGLTILLFSVYNLGLNYDSSAKNKMKIEQVKADLQIDILENRQVASTELKRDGESFRPGKIRKMGQDLVKIEAYIDKAELPPAHEIKFLTDITKLNVELDTLLMKQWGYIGFLALGIILMFIGFFTWHSREQKLRDKMLEIEHALKLLDKVHYRSGQAKSQAVKEFAAKLQADEDISSN